MPSPEPPKLRHQPLTSFAEILKKRAAEEGGYLALAKAISAAYRANMLDPSAFCDTVIIDRRKLKSLAHHDRSVKLSIIEYEALDAYLEPFGEGLSRRGFFKSSSLVQELAQSLDAAMILPSHLGDEGPVLSYWDWRAMAEIQRTVNLFSNTITFDMVDVQRTQTDKPGPGYGKWKHLFKDTGPSSLICIGSPRSNRATERALKEMFNPKRNPADRWKSLPFSFVFLTEKGSSGLKSAFSRPVEELRGAHEKLAAQVRARKGWGLIAGDKSFLSEAAIKDKKAFGFSVLHKKIRSIGVIAAQRVEHRLKVIFAGLTGPGTLAAATSLRAMSGTLPQQGDPHENAVLWCVVETMVDTTRIMGGGAPVLEAHRFVVGPTLWDPKRRCPIAPGRTAVPHSKDRRAPGSGSQLGEMGVQA